MVRIISILFCLGTLASRTAIAQTSGGIPDVISEQTVQCKYGTVSTLSTLADTYRQHNLETAFWAVFDAWKCEMHPVTMDSPIDYGSNGNGYNPYPNDAPPPQGLPPIVVPPVIAAFDPFAVAISANGNGFGHKNRRPRKWKNGNGGNHYFPPGRPYPMPQPIGDQLRCEPFIGPNGAQMPPGCAIPPAWGQQPGFAHVTWPHADGSGGQYFPPAYNPPQFYPPPSGNPVCLGIGICPN
jgi:hypothetical protein